MADQPAAPSKRLKQYDPLNNLIPAERAYMNALRGVTSTITRSTNKRLNLKALGPSRPGYRKRLAAALAKVRADTREAYPAEQVGEIVDEQVIRVGLAVNRQYIEDISQETGIPIDELEDLGDFDPREVEDDFPLDELPSEREAAAGFAVRRGLSRNTRRQDRRWKKENRALIRDLPKKHTANLLADLAAMAVAGVGIKAMQNLISERNAQVKRRGDIIGADQSQKGFGYGSKAVHQAAGFEAAFWTSQDDSNVRPLHDELDGKRFLWSEAPPDPEGFPGEPPLCRCHATPDTSTMIQVFTTGAEAEAYKALQEQRLLTAGF